MFTRKLKSCEVTFPVRSSRLTLYSYWKPPRTVVEKEYSIDGESDHERDEFPMGVYLPPSSAVSRFSFVDLNATENEVLFLKRLFLNGQTGIGILNPRLDV